MKINVFTLVLAFLMTTGSLKAETLTGTCHTSTIGQTCYFQSTFNAMLSCLKVDAGLCTNGTMFMNAGIICPTNMYAFSPTPLPTYTPGYCPCDAVPGGGGVQTDCSRGWSCSCVMLAPVPKSN